jgi:hypothetical protein
MHCHLEQRRRADFSSIIPVTLSEVEGSVPILTLNALTPLSTTGIYPPRGGGVLSAQFIDLKCLSMLGIFVNYTEFLPGFFLQAG